MDKEFYHLAVRLMDNISRVEPNLVSWHDAEMCVILTDAQHVYAGITGVRISNGQLMRACPEFNAIMSMFATGETRVEQMITVSFTNHKVSPPCEGCLELLLRVDPENRSTLIYDRSDRCVTASELSAGYTIHDRLTDPFTFLNPVHPTEEKKVEPVKEMEAEALAEVFSADAQKQPANEFDAPAEEAPAVPAMSEFDAPNEFDAPAEEAPAVPAMSEFDAPNEFDAPAGEPPAVQAMSEFDAPNEFDAPAEEAPAVPAMSEFDAPNEFDAPAEEAPAVPTLDAAAFEAPIAPPIEEFTPAEGAFGPSEGLAPAEASASEEEKPAGYRPAGIPEAAAMAIAEAAAAAEGEGDPDDQFAQFGFEAGDTQDFVNEVRADTDNPFYEPPAEPVPEEDTSLPLYMRDPRNQKPKYLYEQPNDNTQQPAMGYENPQQSMYASQPLPGQARGRMRGTFQPGQSQHLQPQYAQQPYQPGQPAPYQPGQPYQPGLSQQQSQYAQSQYAQSQYVQQPYQPGQSAPYQPGQQPYTPGQSAPQNPYAQPQYAQQPYTPGQNNSQYYSQPQQPYTPQQPAARRESGSAFKQRLSAFMNDDSSHGKSSGKDATKAEMLRLAKEKKKRAKIDADFKKEMKKRGF